MAVRSNRAAFRAGLSPVLPILLLLSIARPTVAQVPADSAALADSARLLSEQAEEAYGQGTRETLERALDLWAQVRELYRRLGDGHGEGNALRRIGNLHLQLGRPDSALVYYREALAIAREVGDRRGEGATFGNIGAVHDGLGRPDSALVYFHQSLAISREVGDWRGEGNALNNMGILHYRLGRPDSSLFYYRQALAVRREVGDRRGEGAALNNMGIIHAQVGRPDSALVYFHQSLAIDRQLGDRRGEGKTLGNIGIIRRGLGQPDSALLYYRQSLAIKREVGDRGGEGYTLSNMGSVYSVLGHPDSALVHHRQALAICREVGDRRGEGKTLSNLGGVHSGLGRPDSALIHYRQALAIHREVGDRLGEATTLSNLGNVHHDLGRPDSALVYYGQSLAISREVGDRGGEGRTLSSLGTAHAKLGRPDSALVYFRRALAVRRQVGDRSGEATTLGNVGSAYYDLERPDSALVYLRQALAIMREVGDRGGEGTALGNVGAVHFQLGRPDSALVYYQQALAIHREVGDREGESKRLYTLGRLHYRRLKQRDRGRAVAYYDSAAAVQASVAAHAGTDPNRLSLAEQYVGRFEDWALAWLARADEVGEEQATRAGLAAAERGRAQALLELMRTTAGAAEGVASPVQQLTTPGADFIAEGTLLAEAVTKSGAAGLSYLLTDDTLVTWLIEPSGEVRVARRAVSRDSVARLVGALRAGLGVDDAAAGSQLALRGALQLEAAAPVEGAVPLRRGLRYAETAAEALAALLLPAELAVGLPESGELVIVPQGPLALVPFSALPLRGGEGAREEPFGNRYAIRYAPSLATLGLAEARAGLGAEPERLEGLRRAVLVGNPRMPEVVVATGERRGLAPLPRAEAEAAWLAERLGTSSLSGARATESVIRRRLGESRLVHLATHGYAYSSESWARQSFVALAPDEAHDGLLTVGEILDDAALELDAELVVLSACQTGLGDLKEAEGTVGLQRAFLAKGARSVLVSLWSVSDVVTEELMKRFYTHWLEDEDRPSKAEALRRAQEEVRRTPEWEHPRFWAAFQLVGAS